MSRFLHVDIHVVVGKDRTSDGRDANRLINNSHFLNYFHEQAVHHTGARWQELDGGYLLMRSAFDPLRGRLTNEFRYVDSGGALNLFDSGTDPATESIRLYSAPEIEALFRSSDLLLVGIYGSLRLPPEPYRTGSSRYLAVGEKPGRL